MRSAAVSFPFFETESLKDLQNLSLLKKAAQMIFDKKGINILGLDLRRLELEASFTLIAEGTSDRHTRALASFIMHTFEEQGVIPYRVEGKTEGHWIVLDFSFFHIQLFAPEIREKYALEELWRDSKIINLNIKVNF